MRTKDFSGSILPPTTAGIVPDLFSINEGLRRKPLIIVLILALTVVTGFVLRAQQLGTESFGEDELNKLEAVTEYRHSGLSSINGEHPFLMKGLQTVSISIADRWNRSFPNHSISSEAALRFPTVLFGSFIALLLYLALSELFGSFIGLAVAVFYALDPNAIGFDRIAKEDTFLLFFFLLANVFWFRGQTVAERGERSPTLFYWLTAAAFGGMMASKYLPHLLAISSAYYFVFQAIPATKWRMGKIRWLAFFAVMGISFVILNPTILLPETWREMLIFVTEKRVGHDAYEFMGTLYPNQMTKWFTGVPWSFYYVFIAFKTPLITLLCFGIGLPLFFRSKMGDGRYFVFFWTLLWFLPYTVLGGKFTRYYAIGQPVVLIIAAIGFCYLANRAASALRFEPMRWIMFGLLFAGLLLTAIPAAPHYRLFTNTLGGGDAKRGSYFPHDEFYDLSSREAAAEIARVAPVGSKVASETPKLTKYYLNRVGRDDIRSVSLSDKAEVLRLRPGDSVLIARGRRYFSNDAIITLLKQSSSFAETSVDGIQTARIYQIDPGLEKRIRKLYGE